MSLLHLFILLLVLGATCVGPGYFFLRRSHFSAGEQLCASIALSLVLVYLAGMSIFVLGIDWKWCWATTAVFVFLAILSATDFLKRLVSKKYIRQQLFGFGFLLLLALLLLSLIRQYSGGNWVFDWLGHFERAKTFLRLPPFDPRYFVSDPLPTRPPLMNVLAAYYLAHVGAGFDWFQVVFLFLNLLVYFPCILIAGLLFRRGARNVATITAFLALTPMFLQNVTWAWTKLLTVFFMLVSVAFYLRAWRKNDPRRMVAAAVAMSAALLVHYSAATCAIALGIHYLLILRHRSRKFIEIVWGITAGALLLATWFGYSLRVFGTQQTFASNTTVSESQLLSTSENLLKIAKNLTATFVPHPFLVPYSEFRTNFYQPNVFGRWRDYFFLIYQTNLTFAWGLFGWVAILWLWRTNRSDQARPIRRFWILFFLINAVVGVAVIGSPAPFGSAHICLQPLILVGVVFLACGFNALPRWMRGALICAMIFDATVGVMLQFRTETFAIGLQQIGGVTILPLSNQLLSPSAILNIVMPQQLHLEFWGDRFVGWELSLFALVAVLLMGCFLILAHGAVARTAIAIAFALLCLVVAIGRSDSVDPGTATSAAQAKYASGIGAYHQGQLDRAADDWVTALLMDPFDLRTRYALQVLLLTHGQLLENTDARFAERVRIDPDDPVAQRARLQQLRQRGISP